MATQDVTETAPTPDDGAPDELDPESRRTRPGVSFAWGIAAGSVLIVLILAIAFVAWQAIVFKPLQQPQRSSSPIVVSPVDAGEPWFSVGADGKGTLEAWNAGAMGTGAGPSEAKDAVGFLGVGALGLVDGVRVTHNVDVYLTPRTEIVIGDRLYDKGKAPSAAAAILGDEGGFSNPSSALQDRPLTIEFHRAGDLIVADRISAPVETGQNPLYGSY